MDINRRKFIYAHSKDIYKQRASVYAIHSTALLFVSLAALLPAALSPLILLLTVPLILLPALFSMQVSVIQERVDRQVTVSRSFRYFRLYFIEPYRGVYRGIWTMIKAALIFLAASFAMTIVFSLVASANPTLQTEIQELNEIMANNMSTTAISEYLENHLFISSMVNAVSLVCLFAAAMSIFFSLAKMSMAGTNRFYYPNSSRASTFYYMAMYRENRTEIHYLNRVSFWYMPLLFTSGYLLGAAIGLASHSQMVITMVYALVGAVLFVVYFLPYYFLVIEFFYHHFHKSMIDISIKIGEETLTHLNGLTPEQKEEYLKKMRDAREETKDYDETYWD